MRLLVDTSQVSFEVGRTAELKTNRTTGEVMRDKRTGLTQWVVQLAAKDATGIEVINVTVAGEEPRLTVGQTVQVRSLEAVPWVNGDRARVAYRAESITPMAAKSAA